ncbi:hypothetical protein [Phenylobacterium sp.]|uniref:hypothetical protein n=1 Tax=Phenylobacterium sp. TaxID=1871053 RepID=UPI002D09382A|nr:hypothetical protein [Phenylobacterium sp.]HVI32793.1 hypothetical protein [Phenylobacterium sp.]
MSKLSLLTAAALSTAALAACAPTMGPPPPGRGPMAGPPTFRAADFGWSQAPGRNGVAGRVTYRQGATRFTCSGAGVVLTPETPWSRRRMAVLYGSTERAALPADEVRARTPRAPAGDAGPFVKRTTCDSADRFSFSGLPDGAWYVITVARPAGQPQAEGMALMRRVTTRGGRATSIEL